jgi:cob(I)alamin adenosyltransferase
MDISSLIATPVWDIQHPIVGNVYDHIEKWVNKVSIDQENITNIEKLIDRLDSLLPPIKNFVVPGNNTLVSSIHICRTVARRCERSFLNLLNELEYYSVYGEIDIHFNVVKIYLNRLSDFFFVFSRFIAMTLEVQEDHYSKSKNIF